MKFLGLLTTTFFSLGILLSGGFQSAIYENHPQVAETRQDTATFAGGCFWCMEPPFDKLDGVLSTTSGYTGGHTEKPTYREVSSGQTGHAEAVQVVYDSSAVTYKKLVEVFWRNIDPTQANGQFCDEGSQYRSAIFYHNERQKELAEQSRETLAQADIFEEPIVTEIEPLTDFYVAEDSHQNFYETHPARYQQYRQACGRDRRLKQLWGEQKTADIF